MLAFEVLYADIARTESRAVTARRADGPGSVTLLFREFYCNDPGCDCRRVILMAESVDGVVATINYAFEPPAPPHDKDEHQVFLDPLGPQTAAADAVLEIFTSMIATDSAWRARLIRHYEMWKKVVDDPSHPLHGRVRSAGHGDPSFRAAFPRQASRRDQAAGPYEPCPCGSGERFKFCCRETRTRVELPPHPVS